LRRSAHELPPAARLALRRLAFTAISGGSCAAGAARAMQKRPIVQQGEVPMNPLIAALVACGGMASFIVFFGIILPGRQAHDPQHS
jgi:hypothetical protein